MKTSADSHPRPVPAPPLRYRLVHTVMCPLMKLMGLSCRQFAELAAVRMDRPLRAREALRFRFHRALCSLCRPLPAQLENLRTLTRCACAHDAPPAEPEPAIELTPEARQRLRDALDAECRNTRH